MIPWTAARQASLSITSSQSLLKLTSIKSVMPSNHLILCHPLLLLPSTFPCIRVFSNESVLCINSYSHLQANKYTRCFLESRFCLGQVRHVRVAGWMGRNHGRRRDDSSCQLRWPVLPSLWDQLHVTLSCSTQRRDPQGARQGYSQWESRGVLMDRRVCATFC